MSNDINIKDDVRVGDIVNFEDHKFGLIVGRVIADNKYVHQPFGLILGPKSVGNEDRWRIFIDPLLPGITNQFSARDRHYDGSEPYTDTIHNKREMLFVRLNTLTVVQRPEVEA